MSGPGSDPRHSGLHEAGGIVLEDHQVELLRSLVEAYRSVEPRQEFLAREVISADPRLPVTHPGLCAALPVALADLRTLESVGFLRFTFGEPYHHTFMVMPAALRHYANVLQKQGQPAERVEQAIRRFMDSEGFKGRHPAATQSG